MIDAAPRMNSTLLNPQFEGRTVVLIHGYGADSFTWLTTTPALLDRASTWLVELPGHGRSPAYRGDGSLADLSSELDDWIESSGLSEVHLIGHSLGARLAMEYAVSQPDRVRSLFLISPAGVAGHVNEDFLQRFHQALDSGDVMQLLHLLVHDPRLISRGLAGRVLNYLEQPERRSGLERMAAGLSRARADVQVLLQTVSSLPIACCTVWGKQDRINEMDHSIIGHLCGDWHLLDNCGHLPHLERTAVVNRLLREFIASQAA